MPADDAPVFAYRVTVRGRFGVLTDEGRRWLTAAQPEHDIFVSAFTPEGTFTYDAKLDFFNLRYEVRAASSDAAGETALREAEAFLRTLRVPHRPLKASVVDLSAMWDQAERRGPTRPGPAARPD